MCGYLNLLSPRKKHAIRCPLVFYGETYSMLYRNYGIL
ncbi:hypothetical protein T05_12929 [Trichinella murrelli]|uniref:Uncharacterized protein n=1 Tax=Trichinella murrelli TaxID=144512 RepID=A0A0V0SY73_9BILA|nr:hypothetical protein T05_12929 [Trichinella murrelli]